MWNHKSSISLLCILTFAVNTVFAASLPCCCTKNVKRACCQTKASPDSESRVKTRVCCRHTSASPQSVKQNCLCSVKAASQTILARDATKPVLEVVTQSSLPYEVFISESPCEFAQVTDLHRPRGPRLLALYCRWRE